MVFCCSLSSPTTISMQHADVHVCQLHRSAHKDAQTLRSGTEKEKGKKKLCERQLCIAPWQYSTFLTFSTKYYIAFMLTASLSFIVYPGNHRIVMGGLFSRNMQWNQWVRIRSLLSPIHHYCYYRRVGLYYHVTSTNDSQPHFVLVLLLQCYSNIKWVLPKMQIPSVLAELI